MTRIHAEILRDADEKPVAVQIGYNDWLAIKDALGLTEGAERAVDISKYAGCLTLTVDPLEYQESIRREWE